HQHRLVRRRQVELPLVELGDVGEQLGGGFVLSRGLGGEFPAKNLVAQVRQREAVHGVTFDGGGWSRADAGILRRANSASAAARTRRERVAGLISDDACPATSCTPAHGIHTRSREPHLTLEHLALEARQFKSTSSRRRAVLRNRAITSS